MSLVISFQNLEDKDRKHALYKEQLHRERRYLRRRLEQLSSYHKRRSVSECSSSTVSSSHSTASHSSAPSPISETGTFNRMVIFYFPGNLFFASLSKFVCTQRALTKICNVISIDPMRFVIKRTFPIHFFFSHHLQYHRSHLTIEIFRNHSLGQRNKK